MVAYSSTIYIRKTGIAYANTVKFLGRSVCYNICWPRIECVHALSTPSTHISETSIREKSVYRQVSVSNFRKLSDKTNICPLALLVPPIPAGNLRVHRKGLKGLRTTTTLNSAPPALLPRIGRSPSNPKIQPSFPQYVVWKLQIQPALLAVSHVATLLLAPGTGWPRTILAGSENA